MPQTRRNLLTRLAQVGLLAAGLEFAAACDRLPGQAPRVPRVGYVANESPAGASTQALIAGLGDYGYIVGQNLEMESRFPTEVGQAAGICSDLLRLGVAMLVTGGTAITVAAEQATSTVPIVGISVGDPVATGLVQSLAQPGGNVTGMSLGIYPGKCLELLLKIEPTLRRVGFLYNPDSPGHVTNLGQFTTVAAASGVEVVPAEVRATADIDGAFEKAVVGGAEALYWPGFFDLENDAHFAALALSRRLVTLGINNNYPAAGGLMSYGIDGIAMWRRAAYFIDRILKGAEPADLPVELPTTFELIVNHTTAAALGITIPNEVAQQVTGWI
jgi:putative ABC transport system substrate-binding protein